MAVYYAEPTMSVAKSHTPAPAIEPTARTRSSANDHRPDIQGLRAIAVGLVVIFHLWPNRLTGGYVGVDVFFVISGFLITAHLMREVERTGTVKVTRFWARRIRRLLPASLLVLLISGLAAYALLPTTTWLHTQREIAASALYVENWRLALDAVDYLAADNEATVAQHYWSLSVEEQFYAVWPLLILALVPLRSAVDGGVRALRRRVLSGLAIVAAASFIWSVLSTPSDQGFAYFSTFTRAWEFASGALLGVLSRTLSGRLSVISGWCGIALIVASGLLLTPQSVFPGWVAAAAVIGTVLVIASPAAGPGTAGWWLSRRPMTFLGDVSYSIYLIHWPLLILTPAIVGSPLLWPVKVTLLCVTIGLAWASKTWVEDPLRRGPLLSRTPRRAYAFGLAGMALVAGRAFALPSPRSADGYSPERVEAAVRSPSACLGPAALLDAGCDTITGSTLIVPPEVVAQEKGPPVGCQATLGSAQAATCVVGDPKGMNGTVALVGDSHAGAWVPTLDELGRSRGWKVVVHTKASCPFSFARRVLPGESTVERARACEDVNDAVAAALRAEKPSIVFVGQRSGSYSWTARPDRPLARPETDGFTAAWQSIAPARVVVLRSVPDPAGTTNVPTCASTHAKELGECSAPRSKAIRRDDEAEAAAVVPAVAVVDLTDAFCRSNTCYSVIGGVVVYRDRSHLSETYARLLAPVVDRALNKAGVR